MMLEDRTVLDRVNDAIAEPPAERRIRVLRGDAELPRGRCAASPTPTCASAPPTSRTSASGCCATSRRERAPPPRGPTTSTSSSPTTSAPSDTASMNRRHVLGFATELGSVNSHTAILARSLGMPAVVGLEERRARRARPRPGHPRRLHRQAHPPSRPRKPSTATANSSDDKAQVRARSRRNATPPPMTIDGRAITLSANIEFIEELPLVRTQRRQGHRSLPHRVPPPRRRGDARRAAAGGGLHPDRRGHRAPPGDHPHPRCRRRQAARSSRSPNRSPTPSSAGAASASRSAARRCSRNSSAPSSAPAPTARSAVMFPLVSGVGEVRRGQGHGPPSAWTNCDQEDIPFDHDIDVGVMIEVPAAAIMRRPASPRKSTSSPSAPTTSSNTPSPSTA